MRNNARRLFPVEDWPAVAARWLPVGRACLRTTDHLSSGMAQVFPHYCYLLLPRIRRTGGEGGKPHSWGLLCCRTVETRKPICIRWMQYGPL